MDDLASSPSRGGISSEVYALLAQANLLRMRGCWEEAIENCMAALRLTPDSHSAQSLLGDIYENLGRYDDAIQWYRMALDLNPHSPADRMKLERLSTLQREGVRLTLPDEQPVVGPDVPKDIMGGQPSRFRLRLKPEVVLRAAALTAALLVLAVVAAAYVSVHLRSPLAALRLAPNQDVKTPLVFLPSAQISPPPLVASAEPRDASEQALLDSLRSSPALAAAGVVAYDAQADPRTARFTLTFTISPGVSGGLNHDIVLRDALQLVQAASTAPSAQTTGLFTVRCLMLSPNAGNPAPNSLVFVGDVSRDAIPSSEAGLSASDVQALFASPWWSPQLPA